MDISPARSDRHRGFVLVQILFLVLVVAGISFASLEHGLARRAGVVHHETTHRALEIAEVGLVRAEIELNTQVDSDGNGIGTVEGTYAGGTYEVRFQADPLLPDNYVLTSVGTHGLSVRRIEAGFRRLPFSPFRFALFAKDDLGGNGNIVTDAFDSRLGTTWLQQAVNRDHDGDYALEGGDLGANGNVEVNGTTATVRGEARPGPLGTFSQSGSPTIWGSTEPREKTYDVQPPPIEDFIAAWQVNDNKDMNSASAYDDKTYTVKSGGKGSTIRLKGGTYFLTEAAFAGKTDLLVTAPCTIYVTGSIEFGAGTIINQTGMAENLTIYVHPYEVPPGYTYTQPQGSPKPQVVLSGGAEAAATVYAPGIDVKIDGNASITGSVVGRNIIISGNPLFHYDRALGFVNWDGPRFAERLYWVERSVPRR